MDVQMMAVELERLGKFINDLNEFIGNNADILDAEVVDELTFDYFDCNGDKLGTVAACDWGNFGFFPAKEVAE